MQNRAKMVLESVEARIRWTQKNITEYMENIQYIAESIRKIDASDVNNTIRMIGEIQSLESRQCRLTELLEQYKQLNEQKAAMEFILKEDEA